MECESLLTTRLASSGFCALSIRRPASRNENANKGQDQERSGVCPPRPGLPAHHKAAAGPFDSAQDKPHSILVVRRKRSFGIREQVARRVNDHPQHRNDHQKCD